MYIWSNAKSVMACVTQYLHSLSQLHGITALWPVLVLYCLVSVAYVNNLPEDVMWIGMLRSHRMNFWSQVLQHDNYTTTVSLFFKNVVGIDIMSIYLCLIW